MANKAISSFNIGTSDNYVISVPYGKCSTAAGTAAKVVSVDGYFSLETGAIVAVKFTITNTANSPTLNVDSTGAKAIYYKGAAIQASYLKANYVYQFIYNGTQWDLLGEIDTNDIPTVNNGTLTIQKNGTNVQTFTANQSTNVTANITVPTKVSELTNDSGYKTTDTDTKVNVKARGTTKAYLLATTTAPTSSDVGHTAVAETGVYLDTTAGKLVATSVRGAVWNDYAEYRQSDVLEAGRVVCENGDDTLSLATERLQPGAEIVSDTFGFAIGETEKCQTPIAVSGRVLAYAYEDRYSYKPGDAVCAAPGGTVSKMTREEIREYPERIVGTVSAIPEYETWGEGNVPVNGRIWIKVK